MVPGLLFADDTALLTESADNTRKSFQCLQSWCEKKMVCRDKCEEECSNAHEKKRD